VVATNDDHLAAGGGLGDAAQKGVIEFLGAIAGGGGVEDIARNEQDVDFLVFDLFREPC